MFFQNLEHTFRVSNPVTANLPAVGLPNLLYKRRNSLKLSKGSVAKIIGVDRDVIGHWESGKHQPRVKYLPAIIRFLEDDSWLSGASSADRLKRFRALKGWSRERLARWLGQDVRHIRGMENGEDPSPALRAAIEAAICGQSEPGGCT